MKRLTLAAIMLTVMSCTCEKVWDITDYGAVGDSLTDNTLAINTAVTLCSEAGGGTVLIPEGNFVSGTIRLA
ncbi:MAG: glycosyl hydrolase family 28-related protein, partial [Candidatus Cryptobacteroides sp.]